MERWVKRRAITGRARRRDQLIIQTRKKNCLRFTIPLIFFWKTRPNIEVDRRIENTDLIEDIDQVLGDWKSRRSSNSERAQTRRLRHVTDKARSRGRSSASRVCAAHRGPWAGCGYGTVRAPDYADESSHGNHTHLRHRAAEASAYPLEEARLFTLYNLYSFILLLCYR